MCATPRNFVAGGGASAILAISEQANIPLAETQKDLTPLQRMVLQKEMERQQEERDSGGQASSTHQPMNSASPNVTPNGNTISGETVEYVNEGAQ